jgi:cysteine synthase B
MPVKLRMPPILRPQVGGSRDVEVSGGTLREVLEELFERYPDVRSQLLDDEGQINRFVNVYVQSEDVRLGEGLDTPVPADGTVIVLPAMAGGADLALAPPAPLRRRRRDILAAIGSTPLVELPRLRRPGSARLWAKLELANPTGSVKDRVALSLIESAERSGELTPGQTIIEPTSGNTGIALAMIAAVKGYRMRAVMPSSATAERTQLLRLYGAEIVFSPGELGSNGAVRLARELAAADPDLYMPFQYGNPANPDAHYRTTGPEIVAALDGRIDAFVAGLGTGGTLMGAGRALREANPDVQIVAAEPLQGDDVMGLRSLADGYTPEILDVTQLDRKLLVSNAEAITGLRALLRREGIYAGVSSGAVLEVAARVAAELPASANVVMLLADGGSRYASAGLWDRDETTLDREMESRLWW